MAKQQIDSKEFQINLGQSNQRSQSLGKFRLPLSKRADNSAIIQKIKLYQRKLGELRGLNNSSNFSKSKRRIENISPIDGPIALNSSKLRDSEAKIYSSGDTTNIDIQNKLNSTSFLSNYRKPHLNQSKPAHGKTPQALIQNAPNVFDGTTDNTLEKIADPTVSLENQYQT